MTTSASRDNKKQLLQDLEQLHSELAQPVDPIPVLLEAVLDEEEWDPLESTCRHASLSIL